MMSVFLKILFIFAKELFEAMKKEADRSLSLVSKSLPIVYFPFLKYCKSTGKIPILYLEKHNLLFAPLQIKSVRSRTDY